MLVGSNDSEDRVADFDLAADFDAVDVFDFVHGVRIGYASIFAHSANSARTISHIVRFIFGVVENGDEQEHARNLQGRRRRIWWRSPARPFRCVMQGVRPQSSCHMICSPSAPNHAGSSKCPSAHSGHSVSMSTAAAGSSSHRSVLLILRPHVGHLRCIRPGFKGWNPFKRSGTNKASMPTRRSASVVSAELWAACGMT